MSLSGAIEMMNKVVMNNARYEDMRKERLLKVIEAIPQIEIYGDSDYKEQLGVGSFKAA